MPSQGTLTAIAAAATFGVLGAWLMVYRWHRTPAPTPTAPSTPAPVELPRVEDVAPVTVRVSDVVPDTVQIPPLPVMPNSVRHVNGRGHHRTVHNLGMAFTGAAIADTQPTSTDGWGTTPPARPHPLADYTAWDIHRQGGHTGLTFAGPTWREALASAGIDPDGEQEKLPDDESTAA